MRRDAFAHRGEAHRLTEAANLLDSAASQYEKTADNLGGPTGDRSKDLQGLFDNLRKRIEEVNPHSEVRAAIAAKYGIDPDDIQVFEVGK